jgi:hypothetical protein
VVCALAKNQPLRMLKSTEKITNCTASEPLRGHNFERVSAINNEENFIRIEGFYTELADNSIDQPLTPSAMNNSQLSS